MFGEIKELYREIAAIKNNTIQIRVAGVTKVHMDKNRLYLVVRNLIDNANKHCQDGEIILSAEPGASPEYIVICVADTGNGMSASELQSVKATFETRPDINKDKLGLGMVHHFVKAMKGELVITSEKEKGTMVKITLPSGTSPEKPAAHL